MFFARFPVLFSVSVVLCLTTPLAVAAPRRAPAASEIPSADSPRIITVTGDADVKVAPDQAVISLGVTTYDRDIVGAKQKNDERVRKVMAAIGSFGIDPRHVQTDQIWVQPVVEYTSGRASDVQGYNVRKSIVVCFKDLARFDELLTSLLKAGVTELQSVQFQNLKLREHQDKARLLAVKAAKDRAAAMAEQLGQKLGPPRMVTESPAYVSIPTGSYSSGNAGGGIPLDGSATFAPGQIAVTAHATVQFELVE